MKRHDYSPRSEYGPGWSGESGDLSPMPRGSTRDEGPAIPLSCLCGKHIETRRYTYLIGSQRCGTCGTKLAVEAR